MPGQFVISLDFELIWGVRDTYTRGDYGRNILGGREAIPRMLGIFERHCISATWATVGFIFCASRDELIDSLPPPELRPRYRLPHLSTYSYINEVGKDEKQDPYSFGASLVSQIAGTPGQEIGTHTFSHYYCLEDGESQETFEADLQAAVDVGDRYSIDLRSIVFPRNQYKAKHLEICRNFGISAYRGASSSYAYRPAKGSEQTGLRRGLRLLDAYSGLFGPELFAITSGEFRNVPASQFLRPCTGHLARVHAFHLKKIMDGMTAAAKRDLGFHLWWHPHNFGGDLEANILALKSIIFHFVRLRDEYGMLSCPMGRG